MLIQEQETMPGKAYITRLLADKHLTVSENRLRGVETYEAFDFLIKRQLESEAFDKANFTESDELIRRGLCVCVSKRVKTDSSLVVNKDHKARVQSLVEDSESISILRKGLRKFFEIDFMGLINKQIVITDDGKHLHHIAVDSASPYTLYITRKEDGENAQLSYSKVLEKYVIGSKNYTICVASMEELASYTHVDALHCVTIARFLMEKIERLDEDRQNKLKEMLEDYTLVGEYVGDVKFEHIVHSSRQTIRFFAMVSKLRMKNEVEDIEHATRVVADFGFEFVQYEKYSKETRELFEVLCEFSSKSANLGFADVLEGYVAYVITPEKEIIFKLKSLAYKIERIYLGLEDAIRRFTTKSEDLDKLTSGQPNTGKGPIGEVGYTRNYLNDNQVKTIGALELDNITKSKLIALLNQKLDKVMSKAKQYEPFLKPTAELIISDFFNRALACSYKHFVKLTPTFFNGKVQLRLQKHRKPIIVLVPMSIPGSGKSYYGDMVVKPYCEYKNLCYTSVSSDKIRNMFIQEYMESNNTNDADLSFKRTDKKASQAFKNEFYYALKAAMEDSQPKYDGYVIFRDRNHPNLKLLESIIQEVKTVLKGYNAVFIMMVPRIMPYFNQGLSYEDLFKCLYRVKNRQNHETLPYKGFETFITVMINCYLSFRSIHKSELDFDGVVDYYAEEKFTEGCKLAVTELIDVFKDYNYYRRDKKPINEKHLYKIRDKYVEAIEKLRIVPNSFEAENKEKVKKLGDEIEKAFRHNYRSLNLLISESHDYLIKDCVIPVRHSVYMTYLPDFDNMMNKTDDWHDAEPLCMTAFRRSKDRQENMQRFVDFAAESRVPVKVYIVVYIVNHEVRLYTIKEHKVYVEAHEPFFVVRKRAEPWIDEEQLDIKVQNFNQNNSGSTYQMIELVEDGRKKVCFMYKLKNERILDALCNVNYG